MNSKTRASIPTVRVTVIFDAICPWCYIGKASLDAQVELPRARRVPKFITSACSARPTSSRRIA